jgi:hypothetical protein
LIRFSIYSDLEILKNSRNRKCEKKQRKDKQQRRKSKKTDEREMGQAHDQPGRERPEKKKHAETV